MPIKASDSIKKLDAYLDQCQQIALDYTYEAFAYLAEACVNRIRDRSAEDSWNDQTGNLRSSIGYIITINGQQAESGGFKPTNAPNGNGAKGQKTGAEYAESIIPRYSSTPIALVVVAGMEYAIYVEARDNKDVLASTQLWAQSEWEKRKPALQSKIEGKWHKLAREMGLA